MEQKEDSTTISKQKMYMIIAPNVEDDSDLHHEEQQDKSYG